MNTIDEAIEVLQAVKDRKTIQAYPSILDNPMFTDVEMREPTLLNFQSYIYRIKPEPLELNIVVCPKANHGYCKCMTKCSEAKTIKVREVIE